MVPSSCRRASGAIGQTMLGTGAPQLLIRLVLPSQPHGNDATALRLSGCWEWRSPARSPALQRLAFVAKVPQFGVAMRDSTHPHGAPSAGGGVATAARDAGATHRARGAARRGG